MREHVTLPRSVEQGILYKSPVITLSCDCKNVNYPQIDTDKGYNRKMFSINYTRFLFYPLGLCIRLKKNRDKGYVTDLNF